MIRSHVRMTRSAERLAIAERRSVWVETVPRVELSGPTARDRAAVWWWHATNVLICVAIMVATCGVFAFVAWFLEGV